MFRWVASASRRSFPTRSSSSRRTKLHSSPAMSSTSTAVTPLTDPVRARRFAARPVKGRSSRGTLLAAFSSSGRRPLSTASHVGLSATARGNLNDPAQSPDRADAVRGRGWCSVRLGGHPMTDSKNCQWILNARPAGKLTGKEFLWNETPVPRPSDGQVLIRTLWLSVDPAQRIWMAQDSYKPAVPLGDVMQSFAVGQVVESRHPDFKPGDIVRGDFSWQDYVGQSVLRKVRPRATLKKFAQEFLESNAILDQAYQFRMFSLGSKPYLFPSAFRFEDVTYSAAGNSFAFYGIAPENDFGV